MIKAVIFDFFGVLVTEGFKQFRENHFGDDKQKQQQSLDLINRVDAGLMPTEDFTAELASLAGLTAEEVHEQLGNNKPNLPLLSYITNNLYGRYKLSILSNSSENYPGQLLKPEDLELFSDTVLSYRYGVIKPQPQIYELAAQRLDVQPEEVIFIDDSSGHCEGAKKAGMKTIIYKDFAQFKTELESLLSPASDN